MTRKDWLMQLLAGPPIIALYCYFIFGINYFKKFSVFLPATFSCMLISTVLTWGNMQAMYAVRRRYPLLSQTIKRVAVSLICYILINIAGATLTLYLFSLIPGSPFVITGYTIFKVFIVLSLVVILFGSAYEIFYTYEKWKDSVVENERLHKIQLRKELDSLKAQVNPHFLFNSLNSLSSLIADDPDKAEAYVMEMSKVYRYLLRNNNVELITLEAELEFIGSYFQLLKMRHGHGIQMSVDVDETYSSLQLPTLTLQLLVENAVKHNIASKESPLVITISSNEKKELIVRNNLQRKKIASEHSNKIGIENIMNKYRLLNQPDIIIEQTHASFSVTLPLIKETAVQAI